MRHILTSVVLIVLLFPALAMGGEVKIEDLANRPQWSGLYYKKVTNVPFTGKTTGKTQGSFRKGKKHGPWVSYHDNGQLEFKGTFKNGKWDGPWVNYNKDGIVDKKTQGPTRTV
jgi:antitoxin component YwqK of YwqJK toxin-antitoxin module